MILWLQVKSTQLLALSNLRWFIPGSECFSCTSFIGLSTWYLRTRFVQVTQQKMMNSQSVTYYIKFVLSDLLNVRYKLGGRCKGRLIFPGKHSIALNVRPSHDKYYLLLLVAYKKRKMHFCLWEYLFLLYQKKFLFFFFLQKT